MSKGVTAVRWNGIGGGVFESLDHVMRHALSLAQCGWDIDNAQRERWKHVPHRVVAVQAIRRHLSLLVTTDHGDDDTDPDVA